MSREDLRTRLALLHQDLDRLERELRATPAGADDVSWDELLHIARKVEEVAIVQRAAAKGKTHRKES